MSKPLGPYSPVVRSGDLLFCSGQVGAVDGAVVDGFDAQVRQAIENASAVLASEGASLTDVVKVTAFLTSPEQFPRFNELYADAFGESRPARSTVVVAALPMGALFEIEVLARVG